MGGFGIVGLWLWLGLALAASILIAVGSMWLADLTLPKPVSEGHNGSLSPFLTCVGLVYGALLGFKSVVAGERFSSSPISQKFLDQLTTLASERNKRILDTKPRIPGLLWAGLLFGGVVLIGLGGFMRLGSLRGHLGLLSAVAVLLGLLLFVVYWLD